MNIFCQNILFASGAGLITLLNASIKGLRQTPYRLITLYTVPWLCLTKTSKCLFRSSDVPEIHRESVMIIALAMKVVSSGDPIYS